MRKKDPRKEKAFAFFHIEIILSFSSLDSFVPQKSAALPVIFMLGLRLIGHDGFICANHGKEVGS
ncbi:MULTISPECIES: hypothetical protein [Aneurinibacillus]|uniref:hypothetical protein n=1 Tax=Aneurinibacillus TaxID=55079 RepID=UPI0011BE9C53|nr:MULTISPECIES: hypothetical protein [Aneurinibacillus]